MKTNIKYSFAALLVINAGASQAASILMADTTYNMNIRENTSCFQAAKDCRVTGGAYTDNGEFVIDSGTTYGSSIGGDGWAGIIQFTTDATGNNYTVDTFNMDMRESSPPDRFATWAENPSQMTGTIDASGNMTIVPRTRMGISGFLASLGVLSFNIDDSTRNLAPTYNWTPFTTGTSSITAGQLATDATFENSITGSALTSDGNGGWNGELVATAIMGEGMSLFTGSPYSEVWNINITAVSSVPVPTAIWLFGSGLLGLVGFAKRKKA